MNTQEIVPYFVKWAKHRELDIKQKLTNNQRDMKMEFTAESDLNTLAVRLYIHTPVRAFFNSIEGADYNTKVNPTKEFFKHNSEYGLFLEPANTQEYSLHKNYLFWFRGFNSLDSVSSYQGDLLNYQPLLEQVTKRAHKLDAKMLLEDIDLKSDEGGIGFKEHLKLATACFSIPQKYLIAADRAMKK